MEDDNVIEQLYRDVVLLQDTMHTLNQMVTQQQPDIDTLEDVILTSKQDVRTACTTLVTADHYRASWYYYTAGLVASIGTTLALLFLL